MCLAQSYQYNLEFENHIVNNKTDTQKQHQRRLTWLSLENMSIQEKLNIFTVAKAFTVWNKLWQLPGCEQRMLTLLKHFLMKRENVTQLDPRLCPQHRSRRLSDDPKGRWKKSHAIRLWRANYGTVKERVPGYRGLRAHGKEIDRGELISQSAWRKDS